MSELERLIQKYCPDGVEYRPLKDVVNIYNGYAFQSKELSDAGLYGVVKTTNIQNGKIDCSKMQYVDSAPSGYEVTPGMIVLGLSGTIKAGRNETADTFYLNQRVARFEPKNDILNDYLYYIVMQYVCVFAQMVGDGGSVKNLSTKIVGDTEIPVPPLPVQQEIVRILDTFTELTAELTAELDARKKQYEHYRDELLPFLREDVEWKSLGDICTVVRGASPRPINKYVTDSDAGINWIKIGDVRPGDKYITSCVEKITVEGAKKSRVVKPGDFILSNSMSFGRPYILQIEGCIHDGWLAISGFEKYVTSDYLYHILVSGYIQNVMAKRASFGGAVQNLNADIVRGIEIPIVSIEEQKKIVEVLDRFSVFCTDISSGLPAEIGARRKQYEHYRDRLLTFKRRNNND